MLTFSQFLEGVKEAKPHAERHNKLYNKYRKAVKDGDKKLAAKYWKEIESNGSIMRQKAKS